MTVLTELDARASRLVNDMVPAPARAVVRTADVRRPPHAHEAVHLTRASAHRTREFVTTRQCVYDALSLLGVHSPAVGRGARGEPLFPDGTTGSLTHCDGLRAAVAVPTSAGCTIGIDAEPAMGLPAGVIKQVSSQDERSAGRRADLPAGVPWDTLLFSAKEALYKAWYARVGCWLDFTDVALRVNAGAISFSPTTAGLRRHPDGPPRDVLATLDARTAWCLVDEILVTIVWLPT